MSQAGKDREEGTTTSDGERRTADGSGFNASSLDVADRVITLTSPQTTNTRHNTVLEEILHVLRLALPLAATNLCAFAISLVSFGFVGRLGSQQLAVVILSTSLFNVTGLSIIQGLNSTLETFCGQAWGAENYPAVGIALQRMLLLDAIAAGIITILWYSSTAPLLRMLGQDPLLSSQASDYLLILAPALWFAGIYEALKRYLAVQGKGNVGAVITFIGLALCPVYNYVLIFTMNLGLDGAALAVVAVEVTLALGLLGYSIQLERFRAQEESPQRTWRGWWSWDSFSGWGLFLRHAVPSIVMIAAEWWSFELLVILSGWLENPNLQLAVMGICLNLSATVWSTISGLSLACSARVAAMLGAGLPHQARQTALISFSIGVFFEIFIAGFIFIFRSRVGYGFTSSKTLVEAVAKLMPVFVLSLPGDGANCVLQGLLRGTGKQSVGALTNMCFYWLIGLPLVYYLGFVQKLGLFGLWTGVAVLNTLLGVVMLVISFVFIDFEKESRKAIERGGGGAELLRPLLLNTESLDLM